MGLVSIFIFSTFLACFSLSYGFDTLDPNGNITVKWDVMQSNFGNYDVYNDGPVFYVHNFAAGFWCTCISQGSMRGIMVRVSLTNFQLFRHIERPGWNLSWTWKGSEVISSMNGAETMDEGDCSNYTDIHPEPHCCLRRPYIVDLGPGAPYNMQHANCCKGGVLSSMLQDDTKYGSAFQMNVGGLSMNTTTANGTTNSTIIMPKYFDIGVPGYSCGEAVQVPPSRFPPPYGHHVTQALYTWIVRCTFVKTRATPAPTCCVSLSAFYNETIVPCPRCSCGCRGLPVSKCIKGDELPPVPHGGKEVQPVVRCSSHMCPIRVHWHIKTSYHDYWRVKMIVTNLNFFKNYSQWNVVVKHPNLRNMPQVYSFNYKPLNQNSYINDTGIFYGIQYYNEMLLQSGEMGNVQSEMLMAKEPGNFTFRDGWAFPRRITFNGQDCVMPLPDEYPMLPKDARSGVTPQLQSFICSFLFLFTIFFREGLI